MKQPRMYNPSIDYTTIRCFCAEPRSNIAIPVLQALNSTLDEIGALQMIPARVAAAGVGRIYWTLGMHNTSAKAHRLSDLNEEERQAAHCRLADEWVKDFFSREGSVDEIKKVIELSIEEFESRDDFRRSLHTIHFVTVPMLWMAFECFARDLWVATLNSASTSLAHRAFRQLEGEDINRKYVQLSELARNGFDLRGKVGNVLAGKYVFTDIDGIVQAWGVLGKH